MIEFTRKGSGGATRISGSGCKESADGEAPMEGGCSRPPSWRNNQATYSLPVGLVAGPVLVPLSGGLPAWVPRLLTPFGVSGCCVVPELED